MPYDFVQGLPSTSCQPRTQGVQEEDYEESIYIYYPHCIAGVLRYPRSQIGAMSEARSYCGLVRCFRSNLDQRRKVESECK